MTGYFIQAFIYLFAAVIAVPIAKRLGLGSVLGYLIAGVMIGPVTGLVGNEAATIQHFAEFGVVMMLFLVGLELEPRMLWDMRHRLIGLGGLQVGLTTAAVMGIGLALNLDWGLALTIGLVFSLSSTAIVLQTFNEKGLTKTEGARSAFSVLLFQDIAVIPMLALIPLLAIPELVEQAQHAVQAASTQHEELSLVANISGIYYALVIIVAITGVVVGGHYLSRPLFKFVASSKVPEIFTATSLMLVIGIAAIMNLVGLSPALGAFLAGVVLATSEFRHQLEATIEPFKGLLLGLFFMTVGAGIDFNILFNETSTILSITLALMLVKGLVLFILTLVFKIKGSDRWLLALSLAQAGEFGFVLIGFTVNNHVLPIDLAQTLSLSVALSMFLTPALFIFYDRVIQPRYVDKTNQQANDDINEQGDVIVAGIGRFGQIVNRLLVANGVKTVVLDHDVSMIQRVRSFKMKSYFGDATQPSLLETAGIANASLFIVAIDDKVRAVDLVRYIKQHYPQVKILARAYDRGHGYSLRHAGADHVVSETYHSALILGSHALTNLGFSEQQAKDLKITFKEIEKQSKATLYQTWLNNSEDDKFNTAYRDLYLQLEDSLADVMKNRDKSATALNNEIDKVE
ncbi:MULTISPECIES: monovalent cation:proton antiporter-2 (CPA2) family protein [unclassified Moritella]|uniref:monovalent cation:proton antiporter-2 (CPA2) family protein n=1 Tax=unclassified Moritella TaxID=2637987 RepID=UPI001BA80CCA|nr:MULTISPECIES: monovalent cation:proton antiporter-2 (CPA2) family protein [unclassified Moritella]QUM86112.1 cation:proton antiporter [Moritella sp. 28]QUM90348.1 cation:proton antiporter [Moritella sp. 36]